VALEIQANIITPGIGLKHADSLEYEAKNIKLRKLKLVLLSVKLLEVKKTGRQFEKSHDLATGQIKIVFYAFGIGAFLTQLLHRNNNKGKRSPNLVCHIGKIADLVLSVKLLQKTYMIRHGKENYSRSTNNSKG